MTGTDGAVGELERRVGELLASHSPAETPRMEFLHAQFDAGLAWVHFPLGLGGLGLDRADQMLVDALLEEAGAPDNQPTLNSIGLGMAAPTILAYGTREQQDRFLRPLFAGEEIWCQLFSEPGAGSDLAGLATRAVRDGDNWIVNGQKVWTSGAHHADYAILVARTDPSLPKHRGLTYFLCDIRQPGVDIRPLRQITGEAEFNEVFLTDVVVPDGYRLGAVGEGWQVANMTLNNERVSIGGSASDREDGVIGVVARTWRDRPDLHSSALHHRLLKLWVDAEVARLVGARLGQKLAAGQPGPEGSALKLPFARINQELSGLELELLGNEGLRYEDWAMVRPVGVDMLTRHPGYRYLRAKGNSIEGGTSEILRNIVSERVLGMPSESRIDKDIPWKDIER